jgi:hypothetical protein
MDAADDDQRRTRRSRGIGSFWETIHFSHDAIFDQPFHIEIEQQAIADFPIGGFCGLCVYRRVSVAGVR